MLRKLAFVLFVAAVCTDIPPASSAVNLAVTAASEQVLRGEALVPRLRGAEHGPKQGKYKEQELLVKFRSGVSPEKKEKVHGKHGSAKVKGFQQLNVDHIRIRQGKSVEQAIKAYQEEAEVEYAEPNFLVQAAVVPNDTYYNTTGSWGQTFQDMWGLHKMNAGEAWDVTIGSTDVIVAVSDTGADFTHPDLQANLWVNPGEIAGNGIDDDNNGYVDDVHGWNFIGTGSGNPADDHGHGTHVAGTIAAATGNGIGIAGISWNSRIMPLKFLDASGSGDIAGGAASILYAAAKGARVVNCSWGGTGFSQTLEDAINYAFDHGVLVVAAAGNNNVNAATFHPASAANVLTVGATDYQDKKASFSNYGDSVEVAAPGVDILSLRAAGTDMYGDGTHIVGGSYYRANGTSMAAPHASGLAGLLFSQHPEWTPAQVMTQIMGTADDIGIADLGTGRINAAAALTRPAGISLTVQTAFDDSSGGNGNGRLDAGETASLLVTLKNRAATAYGVTVELACLDPYVTVVRGTSTVGDIATGATTSTAASPLVLRISPDIPRYHDIVLTVTITANAGTYRKEQTIEERASLYLPGWPVTASASTVSHPVVADMDGDGIPEVLMATDKVWVLKGDGTPLPGWPQPISPAYNEYGFGKTLIAVGDIDNDGSPEVVFTTYKGIYAWRNDGTPVSGFPVNPPDGVGYSTSLSSLLLVDLDNDGSLEIVTASPPTEMIHAYRNDGTTVTGWPVPLPGAVTVGYYHWNMFPAAADIDGDGLPEIVVSSMDKKVRAWRGDGSLVGGWPITLTQTPTTVSLADIDRDGKSEIFFTTYLGSFHAYYGNGAPLAGWPKDCGAASFGDVDGDGNLEIVCGGYSINVFRPDGTSLPGWSGTTLGGPKIWFAPAIGDIDGDSLPDIVARDTTDTIYAWNRNGTLLKGFPLPLNGSSSVVYRWSVESSLALADINGDGIADIVTPSGQYDTRLYALQMPGAYNPATVSWPMLQGGPMLRGEGARVAIATTVLPDAVVGVPYSRTLAGAIGKLPFAWEVATGSLPSGLTLNPVSGAISGTPGTAGSFTFEIRLTDASGNTATRPFAITVRVIEITTTSLAAGRSGSAYSQTLSATGGLQPYAWSVAQGSLPPGLSLSPAGTISGTPGAVGVFDFTVAATGSGGGSGTRPLSIRIDSWTDTRDSGSNEYAAAVGTDSAGNVYVTGYNTSWSIRTIKYSSAGGEVWNKTRSARDAKGIAIDAAGNVYIAGSIIQGNCNCLLLKYDASGNEAWSRSYEGGGLDYCEGVTIDGAGNAYVTGTTWVNFSGVWKDRILVIKYDPSGTKLWHRTYDGGSINGEIGHGIVADTAGNAYVTGTLNSGSYTAAVIKYDPSGNFLWTRTVPGEGRAVAIDPNGNIIAGGYSTTGLKTTSRTVKYTSSGDTLWSRTFDLNGRDYLTSVTTDWDGNAYIAGYTSNGSNNDFFVARYESTGRHLWQTVYDGGRDEAARGVAVDPSGNVWVTGEASNGTNTDYLTLRYSQPRITQQAFPDAASGSPFSTTLTATGGSVPFRWSISSGELPAGLSLNATTGAISGTPGAAGIYAFGIRVSGADGIAAEKPFILLVHSGGIDFIGSPLTGFAPLLVDFSDLSVGGSAFRWDFGDGGTSSTRNPAHRYTTPGSYDVTLTASFEGGDVMGRKTGYVTVLPCPLGTVRIAGRTDHSGFATAYAATQADDLILMQSIGYSGDLSFDRNVTVGIAGGYDCGFESMIGPTLLGGKVSIRSGKLKLEGLRLQ